jgi:hypothetical protein
MDWLRHARFAVLAGALALAGSSLADMRKPLDGGSALQFEPFADAEAQHEKDPCARREKGAWHRSVVHCEEMLPLETISGVLVIAFEERSFFPGETQIPDRNDPRRYHSEPEIDHLLLANLPGQAWTNGAVLMTFQGRRTRYPYYIDCEGHRAYTYVVHDLYSARYLGPVGKPDPSYFHRKPTKPFPFSGEGGKIGEMEKETAKGCAQ